MTAEQLRCNFPRALEKLRLSLKACHFRLIRHHSLLQLLTWNQMQLAKSEQ